MEAWRNVWRKAIVPLAPLEGLIALRKALEDDSPKLLQGVTCQPPPLMCVQDWDCEASDALSFLFWQAGLDTVGEVGEAFARACFEIDQRLGEPAACRWFLNWWDETPRGTAIENLLPEVDLAIARLKEK
jgi:hypothetical protein